MKCNLGPFGIHQYIILDLSILKQDYIGGKFVWKLQFWTHFEQLVWFFTSLYLSRDNFGSFPCHPGLIWTIFIPIKTQFLIFWYRSMSSLDRQKSNKHQIWTFWQPQWRSFWPFSANRILVWTFIWQKMYFGPILSHLRGLGSFHINQDTIFELSLSSRSS